MADVEGNWPGTGNEKEMVKKKNWSNKKHKNWEVIFRW